MRANFGGLMDAFVPGRRVVGLNYPGTEGSRRTTEPLQLDDLADALVAAADQAGLQRFPVLGLSLGSAVAVTAAVRHPERVSGLVLTVGLDRLDAQSSAVTEVWRALHQACDRAALAALLVDVASSPTTLAALSAAQLQEAIRLTQEAYPVGALEHVDLVRRVDIHEQAARLDLPAISFVAGQDRLVLPSTSRRLARAVGGEVVEYVDAGHIFTADEQARWIADIRGFRTEAAL